MRLIAALALFLMLAGCGRAAPRSETAMAQHHPQHSPEALSLARIAPREPGAALEVVSDGLGADGSIDPRYSALGRNLSPPLRWTPVEGARAYAIILEDPDAPMERPFVHWMIWNIPGEVTWLAEGVPEGQRPITPQNAVQGRNDSGSFGYFGPQPPPGTGVHHYHVQVFALDGPLTLHANADLRALVDSMKGRVLAEGELVGTFAAPTQQ